MKVVSDALEELVACGYEPLREIGRGSFAVVYLVQHLSSMKQYAAKIRTTTQGSGDSTTHTSASNNLAGIVSNRDEASTYCSLDVCPEPHFPRLHVILPRTRTIIMEYIQGGDLFTLNGKCDETLCCEIMFQTLCALHCLHHGHQHMTHGDVKLENLLWCPQRRIVKLIDFGRSGGSKNYIAPECVKRSVGAKGSGYAAAASSPRHLALAADEVSEDVATPSSRHTLPVSVDLFSLGVCMYVLLSGTYPFYHPNEVHWYRNVLSATYPPLPASVSLSPEGNDFMVTLLSREATKRPSSAIEAMTHTWFGRHGWIPRPAVTSPASSGMSASASNHSNSSSQSTLEEGRVMEEKDSPRATSNNNYATPTAPQLSAITGTSVIGGGVTRGPRHSKQQRCQCVCGKSDERL